MYNREPSRFEIWFVTSVRGQLEKREIVISIGTKRNLPITAKWYIRKLVLRETPLKQALSNTDQFRFTRNAFVISGLWKGGQWDSVVSCFSPFV